MATFTSGCHNQMTTTDFSIVCSLWLLHGKELILKCSFLLSILMIAFDYNVNIGILNLNSLFYQLVLKWNRQMNMDFNFLLKTHQRPWWQSPSLHVPDEAPVRLWAAELPLSVEIKSPEATSSPKGSWGCLAASNLILNPGQCRANIAIEVLLYIKC